MIKNIARLCTQAVDWGKTLFKVAVPPVLTSSVMAGSHFISGEDLFRECKQYIHSAANFNEERLIQLKALMVEQLFLEYLQLYLESQATFKEKMHFNIYKIMEQEEMIKVFIKKYVPSHYCKILFNLLDCCASEKKAATLTKKVNNHLIAALELDQDWLNISVIFRAFVKEADQKISVIFAFGNSKKAELRHSWSAEGVILQHYLQAETSFGSQADTQNGMF